MRVCVFVRSIAGVVGIDVVLSQMLAGALSLCCSLNNIRSLFFVPMFICFHISTYHLHAIDITGKYRATHSYNFIINSQGLTISHPNMATTAYVVVCFVIILVLSISVGFHFLLISHLMTCYYSFPFILGPRIRRTSI